uniref:Uncharacterized protein n=1 Tax=Strongyloides stercoralis TaxID=6248 RepID=A0A0K0E0M0_STRER
MSDNNSNFLSRRLNRNFIDNNYNITKNIDSYSKLSTEQSEEDKKFKYQLSVSSLSINELFRKQSRNNKRCLIFEILHNIKAPNDIRDMYICNKPKNFDPRINRITPMFKNTSCISSYAYHKIKSLYDLNSFTGVKNFNANIVVYEEYYKSRGKIETELYHKFSEITYGMEYPDFFEIIPVLKGMNKDPDLYLFMVSYHLHNPKYLINLEEPTIKDIWKLINEYLKIKETYQNDRTIVNIR